MIFLLFLIPLLSFAQDFSTKTFAVGMRSSYFLSPGKTDNTLLYYQPEYADESFGETVTVKRNLKFRVFDFTSSDERTFIDPLDVSYEVLANKNSFQIGFLRYRFSETFGFQLLDIANPRDYSEFIFNDLSWSKRSVFGMNTRFGLGKLEVQLILTIWPNGDRLPYRRSQFDIIPSGIDYQGGAEKRPWLQNPEFGAHFKYLFESGFDIGLLAYHHASRPTFFDFSPTSLRVRPINKMVNSLGSSGSYVVRNWVLRGDVLFSAKDLVAVSGLTYKERDHYQGLFGIDRNIGDYVLGLQTQSDFTNHRHFGGLRVEKNNLAFWKPAVMVFKNYLFNDYWFQLRNQFETGPVKATVTYDTFHGGTSEKEVFGLYKRNDRFLVDVSYNY